MIHRIGPCRRRSHVAILGDRFARQHDRRIPRWRGAVLRNRFRRDRCLCRLMYLGARLLGPRVTIVPAATASATTATTAPAAGPVALPRFFTGRTRLRAADFLLGF